MRKLLIITLKEGLLLKRDIEGILLIFFMPILLVIVITLLQDRTFQSIHESKIPLVVVDFDLDSLGYSFIEGIKNTEMFSLTIINDKEKSSLENARKMVADGKYQIGIYIPENSTKKIKSRAINLVKSQLPGAVTTDSLLNAQTTIELFFDPITKSSFKKLVKSQLSEFAYRTEAVLIFKTYSSVINALTNQYSKPKFPKENAVIFSEKLVSEYTDGILPNSVQHNVPAWTLFGMFLICIPIAGNIIKERNDGCLSRIKTMPVSYLSIISGKAFVFVIILLFQATAIIIIGIYLMPVLGMPKLQIGSNWFSLLIMSLSAALAATSYGILIGTIATTQIQASTFGSISTVILAAIGGAWIPVSVMPEMMRRISEISPMNWGIQGYYNVFLRNASFLEILPYASKLFIFYLIATSLSIIFRKYRSL